VWIGRERERERERARGGAISPGIQGLIDTSAFEEREREREREERLVCYGD
jgi:hypothetical protein